MMMMMMMMIKSTFCQATIPRWIETVRHVARGGRMGQSLLLLFKL